MQRAPAEEQIHKPKAQSPRLRFRPVMHLVTGEHVSTLCQARDRYAEHVSFGPGAGGAHTPCPVEWFAGHLAETAAAADLLEIEARPMIVRAPLAALTNANTGEACENVIRHTRFCNQEFCIEITDGALAQSPGESARYVRALRKRGFRVSLDARKAWNTVFDTPMRTMLDAMRINAEKLYEDEDLQRKCTIATAAGITVIAERARWRDAEALSALGVHYAIAPKADA